MIELPEEILLNVIHFILARFHLLHLPYYAGYHRALVALSHVSRTWYYLIDATPSLWAVIHLNDSDCVIQRALAKSQDRPLIVQGRVSGLTPLAVFRECDRWLWVDMEWTIPFDYFSGRPGNLTPKATALLRHFSLYHGGSSSRTTTTALVSRTPFLESFNLEKLTLTCDTPFPSSLTRLSLRTVDTAVAAMLTALQPCTELIYLHLEDCHELKAFSRSTAVPLHLPRLQQCSISRMSTETIVKFLDCLFAPACRALQISFYPRKVRDTGGRPPHWPIHNLFRAFPAVFDGVPILEFAWSSGYFGCEAFSEPGTESSLELGLAASHTDFVQTMSWISGLAETADIAMRFTEPTDHRRPAYLHISNRLPRITRVKAGYNDEANREELDEALRAGLFPNLHTLELKCSDAERLYGVLLNRFDITPPVSRLERLVLTPDDDALETTEAFLRIRELVGSVEIGERRSW